MNDQTNGIHYTPVDESGESHRQMEEASRKLRLGSALWKNFAAEDLNIAGALDDPVCAMMSVANRQNPVTATFLWRRRI